MINVKINFCIIKINHKKYYLYRRIAGQIKVTHLDVETTIKPYNIVLIKNVHKGFDIYVVYFKHVNVILYTKIVKKERFLKF